jgi:hypothetical protein
MTKGTKAPRKRKRIQVGLILSAGTKAAIEAEAARSGLTQSQVAERLIEKALIYDRTVAAMNATLDEIHRRNVHAAMIREGYHPQRTTYGVAYLPPDTPLERSGFKPREPGELEAFGTETIEAPLDEPLTLEQARRNREGWEQAIALSPPTPREKEILDRLVALEAALAKKEAGK